MTWRKDFFDFIPDMRWETLKIKPTKVGQREVKGPSALVTISIGPIREFMRIKETSVNCQEMPGEGEWKRVDTET